MPSVLEPVQPLNRPPSNWKELHSQIGGAVNHAMLETYDGPPLPSGWLDKFRKALVIDLNRRKVLRTVQWGVGHGVQTDSKPVGEGSIPSRPAVN